MRAAGSAVRSRSSKRFPASAKAAGQGEQMRTVLAIKQYQHLQLSCPKTRSPAQSEGPKHMFDRPNLALSRSDLDVLIATLDVDVIGLIECLVSPGWRLSFGSADAPAIHYNLSGTGRMVVGGLSAFPLVPHTLVITPAKKPFHIEVDDRTAAKTVNVVEAQWDPRFGERIQRFVAGDVDPMVMLICGYFRATYGSSIDLFAGLSTPMSSASNPPMNWGQSCRLCWQKSAAGRLECRR